MLVNKTAVMQIGSLSISIALQDGKNPNNSIFKKTQKYAGFQDGEFLDENSNDEKSLVSAIKSVVEDCRRKTQIAIDEILVGIPAEFTAIALKDVEVDFDAQKVVTGEDVDNLIIGGNTYENHPLYEALNGSIISYMCDNKKVPCPIGMQASKISATVSYVLMEKKLGDRLNQIADGLNVKFTFVSVAHAIASYIITQEQRDRGVILLDSGAISTTVAYIKGDGIVHQRAFSTGGENIAADIHIVSDGETPYEHAVELLAKLNLNLVPNVDEEYTISYKGQSFSYLMENINEIAACRVFDIAETAQRAIDTSQTPINPYTEILLTGSGLSTIGGARDIISKVTNRRAKTISSDILQFNKPSQTGIAALILMQQQKFLYKKPSLLAMLIGKLFKKY
jgi:cell division protein FtsA